MFLCNGRLTSKAHQAMQGRPQPAGRPRAGNGEATRSDQRLIRLGPNAASGYPGRGAEGRKECGKSQSGRNKLCFVHRKVPVDCRESWHNFMFVWHCDTHSVWQPKRIKKTFLHRVEVRASTSFHLGFHKSNFQVRSVPAALRGMVQSALPVPCHPYSSNQSPYPSTSQDHAVQHVTCHNLTYFDQGMTLTTARLGAKHKWVICASHAWFRHKALIIGCSYFESSET